MPRRSTRPTGTAGRPKATRGYAPSCAPSGFGAVAGGRPARRAKLAFEVARAAARGERPAAILAPCPLPDPVRDRFAAAAPDRPRLANITHLKIDGGSLHLAFILDAHSRRVVGWSMAGHPGPSRR